MPCLFPATVQPQTEDVLMPFFVAICLGNQFVLACGHMVPKEIGRKTHIINVLLLALERRDLPFQFLDFFSQMRQLVGKYDSIFGCHLWLAELF
jgi:hypothetical protein